MKKAQSPQQKEFEVEVQVGNKTEYKYIWAMSEQDAIRKAKDILKYVPGPSKTVKGAKEIK